MDIVVDMLEGQKLSAKFNDFEVLSDQSKKVGGNEECPEPFDYFLASMPLCAGFFIRQFCIARDISTEGIVIKQSHTSDQDNKFKKTFNIEVTLPEDFPEKYRKPLLAAADSCTVKKVMQAQPEFSISIAQ